MFRIDDPAQHAGLWRPTRLLALLLILSMAFVQPLTGIAQTVAEERGAALAKADAIKEKALLRLSQEATHILAEDRQRFAQAMLDAILAQLRLLEAKFATASSHIGEHMDGGLSLLFTGEEAMQHLLQDKLDRAVAHAGIEAQRTRMNEALEAALADRAAREYQHYRQIFDQILYDVIREDRASDIIEASYTTVPETK